jgi:3-methyladenine DNA glycosylase AlkD
MNKIDRSNLLLDARVSHDRKTWWERYLKGVITFKGVRMSDIRAALHLWIDDEQIETRCSLAEQKALALELISEQVAELKLAGILYLQEVLLPRGALDCRSDLDRFADLFKAGHIADWNTCDWFCVKVLGSLAEQQGEPCARAIAAWSKTDPLWQRRASGVAFVNLAKHGEENFAGFTGMLLAVCADTVQSDERFAQTGTGWVLRELSSAEPERVMDFIEQHAEDFTADGWRYLFRKLPEPLSQQARQIQAGLLP